MMDPQLKRLLGYTKPYKWYVFLNVFNNALYSFFGMLTFLVLKPMLDVLFGATVPGDVKKPVWEGLKHIKTYLSDWMTYYWSGYLQSHTAGDALKLVIITVIGLVFLKNFFGYTGLFFGTLLRNGMLRDLRLELYQKIEHLPVGFFTDRRKGDILTRITGDVNQVKNAALVILEMLVRDPLTIVFTLGAMWFLNTQLTIFILIFVPVSGAVISLIGKKLKQQNIEQQRLASEFLSHTEETLTGIKVIKSFNAEDLFYTKFKNIMQRLYRSMNRLANRQNLASPLSELLGVMVIAGIIGYGGHLVLIKHSLSASAFVTFIGLAYNILTPAKNIARAGYAVRRGMGSAQRVFEILDMPVSIKDKPNAVSKKSFDSEVKFERVYFKYEADEVLKDVSFTIPKGSTVALVGQSGSGKTTLANLLIRFYDVTGGSIKMDGMDIRDIKIKDLRSLMAIVTQESLLFNDTVRNNIAIAKPDATDDEIIRAAKIANAHDFIMQLPQAYETQIGEGGNKLSGGQKQRINIARAVLKNPPLMILDEATSALDTESERLVQEALDKLMKNHTSLVIAHRLSTIKNADLIIVMEHGRVKESGTHAELMQKKGIYHKLVMLQSFDDWTAD